MHTTASKELTNRAASCKLVSSTMYCRHLSILSGNGKRHGFGPSILFGAASGVADKCNPRVAVSVTGGAAKG